jgi:hypothetical protein
MVWCTGQSDEKETDDCLETGFGAVGSWGGAGRGALDTGSWIRQRKKFPGTLIISSRRFEGRVKKEESHGRLRGIREA